jgi:hypothetical protein
MNAPILAITMVLVSSLVAPVLAADVEAAKSRGQCEAGGGVWDQPMDQCVRKRSHRACDLSGGVWDEGSSTCGIFASSGYTQMATGRALFTYPIQGQTPEQQTADRAACHDWAVAQTGYDPSGVFAAQQARVPMSTITNATRRMVTPGGIGGARGNAEVRRLNELYDAYLRAGQVCLEARGYQVSR